MRTDILTEALCGVGVVKCETVAQASMQGHHDLRVAPHARHYPKSGRDARPNNIQGGIPEPERQSHDMTGDWFAGTF